MSGNDVEDRLELLEKRVGIIFEILADEGFLGNAD